MTTSTISTTEAPQAIGVPGLGLLRAAIDPLLSWMPGWMRDMVWAAIAIFVLYLVLLWLIRHGLPRLSTVLVEPLRVLIECGGVVLLLPGYWASTLIRRRGGRIPGVLFAYDDLVQGLTRGLHATAALALRLPAGIRGLPRLGIVMVLAFLVLTWNATYCAGAGKGCTIPTSQWTRSLTQDSGRAEPTPESTRCSKKRTAERSAKCKPRPRSSTTRARD
jgi:hypothetical protein